MTEIAAIDSSDTNMTPIGSADPSADLSYARYDKSTPDNVPTISFDDFLDMINPLQHIPVVSSIYRAVTGESISPAARIAGDAIYGGVFGLASAGISALAAAGDEAYSAISGDGKSASTEICDALFGSDKDSDVQLAGETRPVDLDTQIAATAAASTSSSLPTLQQLSTTAATTQLAALQSPAPAAAKLQFPLIGTGATTATASVETPAAPTAVMSPDTPTVTAATTPAQLAQTVAAAAEQTMPADRGMPQDHSKMPYGGVMDTAMTQSAMQNQAMALAMVSSQNNMQAQHAIRNNRFMTNSAINATPTITTDVTGSTGPTAGMPAPLAAPAAQATASAVPPDLAAAAIAGPAADALPPGLVSNLRAMKGLDHYRNSAQSMPLPGRTVNAIN